MTQCSAIFEGGQIKIITQLVNLLRSYSEDALMLTCPDGIKLINMDVCHIMAFAVKLDLKNRSDNWPKIEESMGLDLTRMAKMLRSLKQVDSLSMFIKPDQDQIVLQAESRKPKRVSRFQIDAIHVEPETAQIEQNMKQCLKDYSIHLQVSSRAFFSLVEETKASGTEVVSLIYEEGQLLLGSSDSLNSLEADLISGDEPKEQLQTHLGLEKLVLIAKAYQLGPTVSIYLNGSSYPVYFSYPVGDLGQLLIALSPRIG